MSEPDHEPRDPKDPDETCDFADLTQPPQGSPGEEDPDAPTQVTGPAHAPVNTAIPEKIGPYPILRELGRGGMGVVYVAKDPGLEREVALKVLPPELGTDTAAFVRFQREAKLLAAINNPSIATIHSLEEDAGLHFLTMELITGTELSDQIKERALPVDEWLALCRQVAVALEAAHRSGIVHLDLKPQNIMVTPEGLAKVLDFGLAMALGRESAGAGEVRTRTGRLEGFSGTPGYMSPEQITGRAIDSRADIWAFGCILYECICKRSAFPGKNIDERARATLESEPDWEAIPSDTPPRMRDLVTRCLTRDVEKRLDTITKARREIEEEIALRALPTVRARSEVAPNNLPVQLASFVGREAQKEEVKELLGDNRLLTLTGVGGGGKTRLSIEVGRELLNSYQDGVWLVELAPLSSGDQVPRAITTVLKLRDQVGRSPAEVLTEHLETKTSLLLLDNCEQVLTDVANLASSLLSACPNVRVLATSRETLNVPGEVNYHVPSMAVPRGEEPLPFDELRKVESIELFQQRAKVVNPAFELSAENAVSVSQICKRLDGIPLAIELAAARIKVLPAEEIAKRLDNRFRLLTSSRRAELPHHQTLRALIDWSYDHLAETEQTLLRRLSLFMGGWTLDAAEAICAGDGIEDWEVLDLLSNLVDKSLVETDAEGGQGTGQARYRMLETIREYARDRLTERKEGPEVLTRHRDYFVALAEEADPQLTGPEQPRFLARLSAEHENLRMAIDLCSVSTTEPELGWRLAGSLGRYFYLRGHWNEGRKAYAELLARPEAPRESQAAANTLNWAGNLAQVQGDYTQARTCLEESLAIRRGLGDEQGVAASVNNLANVATNLGEFEDAHKLYKESLEIQRKLGHRPGIALVLNALGVLAHTRGDFQGALTFNKESLELRREFGDQASIAASLNNLGAAAEALGEYDQASTYLEESLIILRELGDRFGTAASLHNLANLAEKRRDIPLARKYNEEGLATFRKLGDRRGTATSLNSLGVLATMEGDSTRARKLLHEGLSICKETEDRSTLSGILCSLGALAATEEDHGRAARLLGAANVLRGEGGASLDACSDPKVRSLLENLRKELGEESFAKKWDEGGDLPFDRAISYARGESDPGDKDSLSGE